MNWIGIVAFVGLILAVCIMDRILSVRYARRRDALQERKTDVAKDVASIWPSCDISPGQHEGVTMSAMTQRASGDPPEPESTPTTHQQPDCQPGGDYTAFRRDLETRMRLWPHSAFSSQETVGLFN